MKTSFDTLAGSWVAFACLAARYAGAASLALLIAGTPARAQTCAPAQECGDVNENGAVDTSDALDVLRKAVGYPEELMCGCTDGAGPACGNGILEEGEDCEVGSLAGSSCLGLGFAGGGLSCVPGCTFNTSECYAERFSARAYGAVYDRRTELTWETKRSFGGGAADPHDIDNLYTWTGSAGGTVADGTAFTDFLAKLNDNCTISGSQDSLAGSFGARCNWRLPTVAELQSILLATCPGEESPCLDPVFGLTKVAEPYWTAMTVGESPEAAVVVSFGDGARAQSPKDSAAYVRAVSGVMKQGTIGIGFFPCTDSTCPEDSICVPIPPHQTGYCARRCELNQIGIQGSCGHRRLCSDVDPGPGVTPACSL